MWSGRSMLGSSVPLSIFAFITHCCQWAAWLAFPKRSNIFSQRSLDVYLGSRETLKCFTYFTFFFFFWFGLVFLLLFLGLVFFVVFFLRAACLFTVLELLVSSSCIQEQYQAMASSLRFFLRHMVKQIQNWRNTTVCAASTAEWEKAHLGCMLPEKRVLDHKT